MSDNKKELIIPDNTAQTIDRLQGWVFGKTREGHPRSLFDVYKETRHCDECEKRRGDDYDYGSGRVNIYNNYRNHNGKGRKGKKGKKKHSDTWHI